MSEYGFYIRGDGKCAFLKGGRHIGVINCEKDAVHLAAAANTPASLPDDALGKEPVRAAREAISRLLAKAGWANLSDEELQWEIDQGNGMARDIQFARAALALLGKE